MFMLTPNFREGLKGECISIIYHTPTALCSTYDLYTFDARWKFGPVLSQLLFCGGIVSMAHSLVVACVVYSWIHGGFMGDSWGKRGLT